MEQAHFLKDLVVIYGVAALVVFVFQKLRQSNIVGFLMTGVLVGPFGLSLVSDTESVHLLAEIGVILLLFSLGLEFSFKKLMQIRHVVFGTGFLQVSVTVMAGLGLAMLLGLDLRVAVFLGFLVALSSTAIVIKMLLERGEIDSVHGRVSLGVLIFQDLCVIPMIVVIPPLAQQGPIWLAFAAALGEAAVILVVVMVLARRVFPAFLQQVMESRSKELFVITSLWILLGMAWGLAQFGFSLALGAFLAGLTVSESKHSQQIFVDIRPFRDGLNSLFFISIGMLVDTGFIWNHPTEVLATIGAVVAGKAVILILSVWITRLPVQVALVVGFSMAQIGEFSFVLLEEGLKSGLVPEDLYQLILTSAVVTMILTPFLSLIPRKLAHGRVATQVRRLGRGASIRELDGASEIMHDHVLICGFGVTGRSIASVLKANKLAYAILELNARTVREERKNGEPIFFGDCTDPDILTHAGIASARVQVIALSDPFATRLTVKSGRSLNPELVILARNKYLAEIDTLLNLGATEVISEEFETSIELLSRTLRVYNFPRQLVAQEIKSIRDGRYQIFREQQTTVPRIRLSTQLDIYTETFKIEADSVMSGRRIDETNLRQKSGAFILGIIREGETLSHPGPATTIQTDDLLVMSGTKGQLKKAMGMVSSTGDLP